MTKFGAGFELDQNLDLVVSPAGDVSTVEGLDELKKDLSYKLHQALDTRLGQSLTYDHKEELKVIIRGVFLEDPRVEDVTSVSIEPTPGETDQLALIVDAITAEGPFEHVMSV